MFKSISKKIEKKPNNKSLQKIIKKYFYSKIKFLAFLSYFFLRFTYKKNIICAVSSLVENKNNFFMSL